MKDKDKRERFRVTLSFRSPNIHIRRETVECFLDEIVTVIPELVRRMNPDEYILSIYVLNLSSFKGGIH